MKGITEYKDGTLYIDISALDVQVDSIEDGIGYIEWDNLNMVINYATKNNPEVAQRESIVIDGEMEYQDDAKLYYYSVEDINDIEKEDEDGLYIYLSVVNYEY